MGVFSWLDAKLHGEDPASLVDYETADTEVFRRMKRTYSVLDGNENLRRSLKNIALIEAKVSEIPCANTRAAYRRWIPYTRNEINHWIARNDEKRRFESNRHKVPKA